MDKYFTLILTIIFNTCAHLLLKASAMKSGGLTNFNISGIKSTYLQPIFILGLCCFGISVLFYNQTLAKIKLSYAFPLLNSSAYILVLISAYFIFGEVISYKQILGILIILIGIWFLS